MNSYQKDEKEQVLRSGRKDVPGRGDSKVNNRFWERACCV